MYSFLLLYKPPGTILSYIIVFGDNITYTTFTIGYAQAVEEGVINKEYVRFYKILNISIFILLYHKMFLFMYTLYYLAKSAIT